MKKYLFSVLILLPCFFIITLAFGFENLLIQWRSNSNGDLYLYVDWFSYFKNLAVSYSTIGNNFNKFNMVDLNWDGVINCLKSLANILIAAINLILIPFGLFGSMILPFFAFWGLPCVAENPLYSAFNLMSNFQLPYLTY